MTAPHPIFRAFFAWFGYSSVHWAAGRRRRAFVWDALFLVAILGIFRFGIWPFVLVGIGQIVDAALLKPARERSTGGYAIAALVAAALSVLVAVTLRAVWVEAFKIPAGSMIQTLQVGDHILVDKRARTAARGDVFVFRYPNDPSLTFVKRAIAIGGDTIEIRDNQLVLNGRPVERRRVDEPCEYDDHLAETNHWEKRRCEAWDETLDGRTYRIIYDRDRSGSSMPVRTIPPGHVFMLGDNRDNSHDSRFWGTVPPENSVGVARKIWWSNGPNGIRWERVGQPIR